MLREAYPGFLPQEADMENRLLLAPSILYEWIILNFTATYRNKGYSLVHSRTITMRISINRL